MIRGPKAPESASTLDTDHSKRGEDVSALLYCGMTLTCTHRDLDYHTVPDAFPREEPSDLRSHQGWSRACVSWDMLLEIDGIEP